QRLEREFRATANPAARQLGKDMAKLEPEIWSKADVIYYYSNEETDSVRARFPERAARTLPIFLFDQERLSQARERVARGGGAAGRQVIFVAGFRHPPNIDGLLWFVATVWPEVVAAIPEARLVVVGSFPPPEVLGVAGP